MNLNLPFRIGRRADGPSLSVLSLLVAVGALGTLAACSSVPDRNMALEQAQARYNTASTQPQVQSLAVDELRRASEALRLAEQAKANGESMATVDHLAYLASQRVGIAQDAASGRAAQAVTAGAGAERDRLRLAQRTQEADTAQRQLAASQQANATTSQQLASSQRSVAATTAQLAVADAQTQSAQSQLAQREAQVGDLQSQMRALNARKTERGIVVTLGELQFATGQAKLKGNGDQTLGRLAEFFKRNPQRRAAIEGYTDSVGSVASNQALSDRRASAVLMALVDLGVDRARLTSEGFGPARPVAGNDNAGGRQQNRRVEVIFAPEAGDVLVK